ncbi:hypothetical protein [Sphingobacterium paludis]|uniref:Uncharacterized protein n=1 Tax=Sphingobacterium paludis TaxID=1476465 RepID=A0A4R7CQC6_9SPHI|nr:hypothetical protein [Sphingobacterium paludis]TDS06571.1 hypothetical protein B0I21_11611 [Sphingobacterium paludis]
MIYRLTSAQYLNSSSVDEIVLCYQFLSSYDGSKYLVWIQITELFDEWKELFGLDDNAMLKFLLKTIEPDLIRSGFKYRLTTYKIPSSFELKAGFKYEDYNLNNYELHVSPNRG